jgi:hypothetical protein
MFRLYDTAIIRLRISYTKKEITCLITCLKYVKSDYGCLVQLKHETTDGLSYCLSIVLAQQDERNSLTDFGDPHEPLCRHTCDVTAGT